MKGSKSVVLASVFAFGSLFTAITPAHATLVSYTTTGIFSGGTNTTSPSSVFTDPAGGTATFSSSPVNLTTPAADSLGGITVNVTKGSITGSGSFTLTINQSAPPGNGDFGSDAFTGTISGGGSPTGTLILTFADTSITIAGVTYTLEDLGQNGLANNQLGIGNGPNNIEAYITATPEPAFYGLTGVGLAGLLVMALRRRKQAIV